MSTFDNRTQTQLPKANVPEAGKEPAKLDSLLSVDSAKKEATELLNRTNKSIQQLSNSWSSALKDAAQTQQNIDLLTAQLPDSPEKEQLVKSEQQLYNSNLKSALAGLLKESKLVDSIAEPAAKIKEQLKSDNPSAKELLRNISALKADEA